MNPPWLLQPSISRAHRGSITEISQKKAQVFFFDFEFQPKARGGALKGAYPLIGALL